MKPILALLAGLLGTGLLAYFCAAGHRDAIQQDLTGRTKAALARSTVSDLLVAADGREITLRGVVPSEEAKREVGETAKKIYGVHTVTNLLEVRVPPPLPASPPPLAETSPVVPPTVLTNPPASQKPVVAPVQRPPVQKALAPPRGEHGQPEPSQCQKMLEATLNSRQIQFETGKAVLRPSSYPTLDRLAVAAKKCAVTDIEVSGHTDSRGARPMNMRLSKMRAQTVITYLMKKGVPAQRLTAIAHGSTNPLASNATTAGMQRNRRVEFAIKSAAPKARQP